MYNLKIKEIIKLKYKNAKNILPQDLLQQIQQYIQGDVIYIPIDNNEKIPISINVGLRLIVVIILFIDNRSPQSNANLGKRLIRGIPERIVTKDKLVII